MSFNSLDSSACFFNNEYRSQFGLMELIQPMPLTTQDLEPQDYFSIFSVDITSPSRGLESQGSTSPMNPSLLEDFNRIQQQQTANDSLWHKIDKVRQRSTATLNHLQTSVDQGQNVSKKRKNRDAEPPASAKRCTYEKEWVKREEALRQTNKTWTSDEDRILLERIKIEGCSRDTLEKYSENVLYGPRYNVMLRRCLQFYQKGAITLDTFQLPKESPPSENILLR